MSDKTIQAKIKSLHLGDLCSIDWKDHFRYKGTRPDEMVARSWGIVDAILPEGIALLQNQCLNDEVCERVMDGQFILTATIVDIKKL